MCLAPPHVFRCKHFYFCLLQCSIYFDWLVFESFSSPRVSRSNTLSVFGVSFLHLVLLYVATFVDLYFRWSFPFFLLSPSVYFFLLYPSYSLSFSVLNLSFTKSIPLYFTFSVLLIFIFVLDLSHSLNFSILSPPFSKSIPLYLPSFILSIFFQVSSFKLPIFFLHLSILLCLKFLPLKVYPS